MEQEQKEEKSQRFMITNPRIYRTDIKLALTSAVYSPLSYGLEFESGLDLHHIGGKDFYDRKILKESGNLVVTAEDFGEKIIKHKSCEPKKDEKKEDIVKPLNVPCPYNLEIAMGVYEYKDIFKFINNIGMNLDMEQDLNKYKEFIENEIKEQKIRRLVCKEEGQYKGLYNHCYLQKRNEYKEGDMYKGLAYKNYDKDSFNFYNLMGKPQITIGLHYLWYLPIYEHMMNIRGRLDMKLPYAIMNMLSSNHINFEGNPIYEQVFKGLLVIIINYSHNLATFVSKDCCKKFGVSYFKSKFPLKPRSNLYASILSLEKLYPNIFNDLDKVLENIGSKYIKGGDVEAQKIYKMNDEKSFYEYKNNFIETHGKDIIEQKIEENKQQDYFDINEQYIAKILNKPSDKASSQLLLQLTYFNIYYHTRCNFCIN
jgi:hypothetical protein